MALKLKTKKMIVWVLINEDLKCESVQEDYELGEGECMFQLGLLDAKETYRLVDGCYEYVWDKPGSGQAAQRFDKPNWYKMKVGKIKKLILNWKGVLDEDGVPISCTDEMKEQIFLANQALIDAVVDFADKLQAEAQKVKEGEIKNLNSGQNGSSETEQ
jgi:hypothetical protein